MAMFDWFLSSEKSLIQDRVATIYNYSNPYFVTLADGSQDAK
jgi:hypothetical protein